MKKTLVSIFVGVFLIIIVFLAIAVGDMIDRERAADGGLFRIEKYKIGHDSCYVVISNTTHEILGMSCIPK